MRNLNPHNAQAQASARDNQTPPDRITGEDRSDSSESICPYCQYPYQVEAEDYSEDGRVIECSQCERKYHLTQSFSVYHNTTPDCELNGEPHEYRQHRSGSDFCKYCGQINHENKATT